MWNSLGTVLPMVNLLLVFGTKINQKLETLNSLVGRKWKGTKLLFYSSKSFFYQQETKKIIVEMTLNLETPLMPFFREIFIFTLGVTLIFSLLLHEHSVEFWDLFPKITFFSLCEGISSFKCSACGCNKRIIKPVFVLRTFVNEMWDWGTGILILQS